jgi:hypothetical protein
MEVAGGGWTLAAKVKGSDILMNRQNDKQWREGRLIGDPTSLSEENALGLAYTTLPFREVMIQSLVNTTWHLAWRHPRCYSSIQSIVKSCTRIANGVKISGGIDILDFTGSQAFLEPCTELVYGFMGGDHEYAETTVAGCAVGHQHGNVGAVVGAFLDPPAGDRSIEGQNNRCISDFGLGGGLREMDTEEKKFAINAHFWNNSNEYEQSWGAHAIFIR